MFYLGFEKIAGKDTTPERRRTASALSSITGKDTTPEQHRAIAALSSIAGVAGGLVAHSLAKTERGELQSRAKALRIAIPVTGAIGAALNIHAARKKEKIGK